MCHKSNQSLPVLCALLPFPLLLPRSLTTTLPIWSVGYRMYAARDTDSSTWLIERGTVLKSTPASAAALFWTPLSSVTFTGSTLTNLEDCLEAPVEGGYCYGYGRTIVFPSVPCVPLSASVSVSVCVCVCVCVA